MLSNISGLTHQFQIQVNGNPLEEAVVSNLFEVVVDTTLHLPAMFLFRLHDDELKWLESGPFDLGAKVEIALSSRGNDLSTVITGEITALEPEFSDELHVTLTIRGYDFNHRLNRGTKMRVFVQMSDTDIVNQIVGEANLQAQVDQTSAIYEHVFQNNLTDLEFLQQRARRIGFEIFIEEETLYFRKPDGRRGDIEMEWGTSLMYFNPRLSLAQQVNDVTVKGWDATRKQAIIGKASRSDMSPEVNFGGDGGQVASSALSAAKHYVVRRVVTTQDDADAIAQSILDEINASFIEADGIALGNPQLVAGKKIKVNNIGQRFSGSYMVTTATHIYTQTGYDVEFRVEGSRSRMMSDFIEDAGQSNSSADRWGGVVSAIVTNNNDPKDMYRVKVKFPWMDDNLESHWIRVMTPSAGSERGLFWLPEVNDEVLVAFDNEDFNHPYVLGSLWNGEDTPAESVSDAVNNGEVVIRTFKTRLGHVIRFADGSSDAYIQIQDADGVNEIKLDMKGQELIITTQGKLNISSDGELTVDATGALKIKGAANIDIEASGNLTLKGATINLN